MARYRKRPVEIEAWLIEDVMWFFKNKMLPEVLKDAHDNGILHFSDAGVVVQTLEGNMRGRPDAYLIQGVKGEFYACDPVIFKSTYDVIDS